MNTKKILRMSELKARGYPEEWLREIVKRKEQNFAWRTNPTNPRSAWLFDAEKFEKYLEKQNKLSKALV